MIKLIREGSKKYPWILKIIMLVIAGTFMIGMGWFGYEPSQQPNVVAVVGAYEVDAREFRLEYRNAHEYLKKQSEQDIVEADLKQTVINRLVGQRLWLVAADDFDLDVHPDELRQAIMKRKDFAQDGSFDPALYHRLLAQNKVAPKEFEGRIAKALRTQKVQYIVQSVATLNPAEMEEVEELAARQAASMEDEPDIETIKTRIRLQLLNQKQQRALQAYQTALGVVSHVEIRNEFL